MGAIKNLIHEVADALGYEDIMDQQSLDAAQRLLVSGNKETVATNFTGQKVTLVMDRRKVFARHD